MITMGIIGKEEVEHYEDRRISVLKLFLQSIGSLANFLNKTVFFKII